MFLQQKISFQAFFHIEKERERVGVYKCEKSQFMNGHVLQQNNLLPLINSISCLTLSAGAVKRRPSQRIVVLPQFLKTCCVLHKLVLFWLILLFFEMFDLSKNNPSITNYQVSLSQRKHERTKQKILATLRMNFLGNEGKTYRLLFRHATPTTL